jgi:response regulator of citrate/malate metabolism
LIRTLVVDDDFRVAGVHAAYLEQVPGFCVAGQAHSAAAMFDAIARGGVDLVLLDLYLPDLHGLECLRRLRAAGVAGVDVIVITAANDVASVRAAMQGGALHYLLKPFDLAALRDKLVAYHAMRNELASARQADQRSVDRLFGALASPAVWPGPAGVANHTLKAVEAVLAEGEEDLSAAQVAERLGISRATAQRYLARLEALSRATARPRYGKSGRPENRYSWGGR